MARINKVKPKWKPPMNKGSPVARVNNATSTVNSTSPARAAGADDSPGSRFRPHCRDRPI